MQASDIVQRVEGLHRETPDNWAALLAALPEGALAGETVWRERGNDAEYQATLDRLASIWTDGELDRHFWPAIWRYKVARKVHWLVMSSVGLLAFGGLPLWAFDFGLNAPVVLVGACLLGAAGLVVSFCLVEFFTPFRNDDSW